MTSPPPIPMSNATGENTTFKSRVPTASTHQVFKANRIALLYRNAASEPTTLPLAATTKDSIDSSFRIWPIGHPRARKVGYFG